MKNWKFICIPIIIIFSTIGTIKIINLVGFFKAENHKNKVINDYRIRLKNCFDLENKKDRSIDESLRLIEYCVKEFGLY